MTPTIFIKFCVFMIHSNPNNMTLSAFPEKIPETGKIYFNFFSSPNAGPKRTHQFRSKSISRVLSQISRTLFFSFHPNPKIKGSLHKKKIKNFYFLKNGSNDFDYILWINSTFETQQCDTSEFSRKNP